MKYTDEMKEFIIKHYKGITSKDLANIFNEKFKTDIRESQMKGFKSNNRLASGVDCKFVKGQTSYNKGQKGVYYKGCEKGWFKKGDSPHNHKPVGSERIDNKDGYTLVKTKEPKTWELKQHIIWKQHNGEIPKGYKVIFLNRDKTDLRIENLAIVSKAELLTMNRNKLIYSNSDATTTGILIAKVIKRKYELKKQ